MPYSHARNELGSPAPSGARFAQHHADLHLCGPAKAPYPGISAPRIVRAVPFRMRYQLRLGLGAPWHHLVRG